VLLGIAGAALAFVPWLATTGPGGGADWLGFHAVAVCALALAGAAIALLRQRSKPSPTFLLLGAGFLASALVDGTGLLATRLASAELSATAAAWPWLVSRTVFAGFLFLSCRCGLGEEGERPGSLGVAGGLLALATVLGLAVPFLDVPPLVDPEALVARPFELIPAALFGWALVDSLRRRVYLRGAFELLMAVTLLVSFAGQTFFMPFARSAFDPFFAAGQVAKSLGYLAAVAGLLSSMYALFRQADESASELARAYAAVEVERWQRNLAEQERDRFFAVSPDLLSVIGFDGYFRQLNSQWERTLGYSSDELSARRIIETVHPEDRAKTLERVRWVRQGGTLVDFENRHLAKDGTYRWLSWRAAADVERQVAYAVARDVTERKRIEEMKNDFISVVSHELRTPLTSIRGSLGLLAAGVVGALPERAKNLVEIAAKNSERLVRLINDMLDIEKIESGKIGFRYLPGEMMPLVEQAVSANRAFAGELGVELAVVASLPGARCWVDADRIVQVLTNLLSNAAKFAPRGSTVEVAVERRDGDVIVGVADRGAGIPPEFEARVFDKFAQADTTSTRQKEGTGLGLAISKAIIERHGGRIWFESTREAGTTFFFALPEWQTTEAAGVPALGARPRVLVCEDDPEVSRLLQVMLELEGYLVDVAATAAEARELLAGQKYAAMTVDLLLPDGSGIALIRELKERLGTRELPVVVISVVAEEGRLELTGGGAVRVIDWLGKPVDRERLAAALHRAVAQRPAHGARILHVEDDGDLVAVVRALVGDEATVVWAPTLAAAREMIDADELDLVLLDLALPDGSGLELLSPLATTHPTPVIIFSAHEVDERTAGRVAAVLVKSRTSHLELLDRIRTVLAAPPTGAAVTAE
jgi:PAS domain S-box-containing protein